MNKVVTPYLLSGGDVLDWKGYRWMVYYVRTRGKSSRGTIVCLIPYDDVLQRPCALYVEHSRRMVFGKRLIGAEIIGKVLKCCG